MAEPTEQSRESSGTPNVVKIEPGDPRYCPLSMAGEAHDPHQYHYEYDRPEHLGGHTKGRYLCDGGPL